MNRYLLTALYVVAGCVAVLPAGGRGGVLPAGTGEARVVVTTEVGETAMATGRETRSRTAGKAARGKMARGEEKRAATRMVPECKPGGGAKRATTGRRWPCPGLSTNPIRAPGGGMFVSPAAG